jgi:putative MATE family efflux protein
MSEKIPAADHLAAPELTSAQKKGLWGMSRPLLVEQALQLSVPLLDTFFLSRVSDSAASAAGAMTPAIFFCVNILWVTVFAGSSIASQRLGAGKPEQAVATIATYSLWILLLGALLTLLLYVISPWISLTMGLPAQVQADANSYMAIVCLLMVIWAAKLIFQSILNIYGQPQWNMLANIVFFGANCLGNSIVVFGWFGCPPLGIQGVAWASVIALLLGVLVSGTMVFWQVKLGFHWHNFKREFRSASQHTFRIALPSMIEPMSFDLNMIVLNSFAASLGAAALAAKIYTFNTFLVGLIITMALTMASEVLICQFVGAARYHKAIAQMRQSLKAALWGSGLVVFALVLLHSPIMHLYTDNEVIIASAFWLFLLAALSEPPRAVNVMVGGVLRATGDGMLISTVGPLFTWLVAVPAAYVMAFVFGWGLYGIMLSAILDEGCRSLMYWKRWKMNRWQHSHVQALEQKKLIAEALL